MEQEPVYVPSGKLNQVCEAVLGRIYDIRQSDKERYINHRVTEHNLEVIKSNKYRKYLKWLGVKPKFFITPHGMEQIVFAEAQAQGVEHDMIQIHSQYAGLEHETKDCMIQCGLNETVPVSSQMIRGISHLGLDMGFMAKPKFGFYPR